MSSAKWSVYAVVAAELVFQSLAARADVVTLRDGDRVHGTVVARSATIGVQIRVADGVVRTLEPGGIDRIAYDNGVVVDYSRTPPPGPALDSGDLPPTDGGTRSSQTSRLVRPGLFAAGIAMTSAGVTAMGAGIDMLALRIRTGCVANHQPVALGGSDDRGAADFCLAGVILFLVGLPVMNVGLALWLHNRDRVQVQSSAWMPQIGLGRRGPALRWDF